MKILWSSNGPAMASGYGQQTGLFVSRIKKSGREISILAFNQIGSLGLAPDGTLQLPRVSHPFGNDVVVAHFQNTKSDYIISLMDPFALDPEEYGQVPWCAWAPIDSEPIYPGSIPSLKKARWIWAMSRWGESKLKEAGFGDKTFYVPHGVDSKVFAPRDRAEARQTISKATGVNLDGKYIVAVVAANKCAPSRKGFYEAFAAFKAFSDSHKDAVLYLHSEMSSSFGGEELPAIMDLVKLSRDKVAIVPQYPLLTGVIQPSYMAAVYNAADVYLSASHTEGFGLPALEAQMCGCQSILPNNSAQTEICFGKSVKAVEYMSLGHVTWKRPLIDGLVSALENAHAESLAGEPRKARERFRERALNYDADTVFKEHMLPALARIEQDLKP